MKIALRNDFMRFVICDVGNNHLCHSSITCYVMSGVMSQSSIHHIIVIPLASLVIS